MELAMASLKNRKDNKDDGTVLSTQKKPQGNDISTRRLDLNEIKKRNTEEEKQDRKSIHIIAGIIALLVLVVIVLVYFFS